MSFLSGLGQGDFGQAVRRLWPRGRAFSREPGALVGAVSQAMGDSLYGLHAAAVQFLEGEADPRFAVATLVDWESDYGLPDPCTLPNTGTTQRRAALLAKIAALGGQSTGYYVGIAAALGYTVTISGFAPMRLAAPLWSAMWPQAAVNFWQISAPQIAVHDFQLGLSVLGDPFWVVDDTAMECRIRQVMPADSVLLVSYGSTAGTAPLGVFVLGVNKLA